MKSPKFSIIIPVYNVAPYLRECLDSVLVQTYTSWEAICVDDGSTDGSGAILDEYAAKDPRFRVIHQVNAGVSEARNVALDSVHGEWILFVDADDWLEASALERFEALSDKADITFFCPRMHFQNGEILTLWKHAISTVVLDEKTALGLYQQAFDKSVDAFGWPWNKFIRAECVKEVRYLQSLRMFEDELFILQLCNCIRTYCVLDWPLYNYRIRESGATNGGRHDWATIAEVFEQEAVHAKYAYLAAIARQRARVLRRLADADRMKFSHWIRDFIGASELKVPHAIRNYRAEVLSLYLRRGSAFARGLSMIYRWIRKSGEFAHGE